MDISKIRIPPDPYSPWTVKNSVRLRAAQKKALMEKTKEWRRLRAEPEQGIGLDGRPLQKKRGDMDDCDKTD